ncbi:hypothetical protein HW555_009244, partial [Spodoptera exigua]
MKTMFGLLKMNNFRGFNKKSKATVIFHNVIDKDVQSMLQPFTVMQFILFCPRYRIKDNFITPNTTAIKIVSMLVTLTFILSNMHRTFSLYFYKNFIENTTFVYIASYYDCICSCLRGIVIFTTTTIQSEININFVLTFQKVHRVLNEETSFRRFITWNWTIVFFSLLNFLIGFSSSISMAGLSHARMLSCYFLIVFDVNVVYFFRILVVLEDKVLLWNIRAFNYHKTQHARDEEFSKQMFEAYLLYYIFEEFTHGLVYTQVAIETLKRSILVGDVHTAIAVPTAMLIWGLTKLFWHTIVTVRCEKFYIALQNLEDNCSLILMLNIPGSTNVNIQNTVDKDVQSMLRPFTVMQYVMCCPRYRIKNNFITPNSTTIKCISMFVTLAFTWSIVHRTKTLLVIVFIIATIQTKRNIKFVLTFQKVHRFLNDKTSFNHFTTWNWIVVFGTLSANIIMNTFLFVQAGQSIVKVYSCYFLIFFDCNIIYFTRMIKVLEDKVFLWNSRTSNFHRTIHVHDEEFSKQMFQAYVHILESYNIHKASFSMFIFYYFFEIFSHSLLYSQVIIEMMKNMTIDKLDDAIALSILIFMWQSKDLLWQTIVTKQCEKLYLALQRLQDTCSLILMSSCSVSRINNFVENDVQSVFLPFNIMQYIMFSPRYCIKRNFISPNSIIIKLFSMFATLVFIFSIVQRNIEVPLYKELDG